MREKREQKREQKAEQKREQKAEQKAEQKREQKGEQSRTGPVKPLRPTPAHNPDVRNGPQNRGNLMELGGHQSMISLPGEGTPTVEVTHLLDTYTVILAGVRVTEALWRAGPAAIQRREAHLLPTINMS